MEITKGTVVFVTGGASGLGEAAVRHVHTLGASVVIADFDVQRMQSLFA